MRSVVNQQKAELAKLRQDAKDLEAELFKSNEKVTKLSVDCKSLLLILMPKLLSTAFPAPFLIGKAMRPRPRILSGGPAYGKKRQHKKIARLL